jgi:membrane-bound lytic murein transglycosylase D
MMSFISNSTDFMLDNESEYLLNRANNATFTKVEVKSGTMIKDVALSIGISLNELKSYNPHIKRAFVSPIGESNYLYIPQDRQVAFTQNFDNTKNSEKYAVYSTKKGDSLQSIAKAYGISDKAIIELNALSSTALKPQTELVIPVGTKTPAPTTSAQPQMYTIKMGDTMDIISKKHNISVAQLMKTNNKKDKFVKVGESIVIPKN